MGPPVRVVATNFGGGKTVPANGSVAIAFDRVLHPASVNRQAAVVVEVGRRPIGNPSVSYDPVTRILSLSGPNALGTRWLTPGQPYEVLLTNADAPETIGGVRAIDGAPIDSSQPTLLAFFAGPEIEDVRARGFDPETEFCRDVLPIFRQKCSGSTCHGTPNAGSKPAMSLVLTTSIGVANTALRRVSQEADTGPRAGLGASPGRAFGVDMPIIDPGTPAASWLMYKVMMARPGERFGPAAAQRGGVGGGGGATATNKRCDGSPGPAPVVVGAPLARFAPIEEEERSRLSDAMLGLPMPYPDPIGGSENLTHEELERIRAWIGQGANVTECGACLP